MGTWSLNAAGSTSSMVCVPSRVSQNRRIGQGRKGPQWVIQSTWHRIESRRLMSISGGGYATHSPSGQSVPVLTQLHTKEVLHVQEHFCACFCPLRSVLLVGTTEKSLAPCSGQPPYLYFYRGIYIYHLYFLKIFAHIFINSLAHINVPLFVSV